MPSGNKPLPEPVLTKFSNAIWRHQAPNELLKSFKNWHLLLKVFAHSGISGNALRWNRPEAGGRRKVVFLRSGGEMEPLSQAPARSVGCSAPGPAHVVAMVRCGGYGSLTHSPHPAIPMADCSPWFIAAGIPLSGLGHESGSLLSQELAS